MFLLALSLLLAPLPADTTADRDACINRLPATSSSQLPVGSFEEAQRAWTGEASLSSDTVRSYLARLRMARSCFRALPPAEAERPYLDVLYTYEWEAQLHAALREFDSAFGALAAARTHLDRTFPGVDPTPVRAEWRPKLHQDEGYLRYVLGDLSSSISHYLKALRATPDSSVEDRAEQLYNVGTLYNRIQDYRSARHYYQRAERLLQSYGPSSSLANLRSRIWGSQANLLLERTLNAQYDRANLERARRRAQKAKRAAEPGTERHAHASLVLSESLGYLGSYDEAYRLNGDVRAYARRRDDPRLQTFALYKLGVLHLLTERWDRADSVLTRSLTRARALGDLDYQRRILRDLGRAHEMQGQWAEAERFYRDGVDVIEAYRESLTASQWSATAFSQWRDVYRGLVRTLLAQDQPRAALAALDRTRARHLRDLRTQARVARDLSPGVRARFDSLTQALTDVRNRLDEAAGAPDSLHNQEALLVAARRQLLNLPSATQRPPPDSVAATLGRQGRALVSYFLDDPWPIYDRAPRSTALVLTPDTLRSIPLPDITQDSVRTLMSRVSPLFRTGRRAMPDANTMHFDLRPLHVLHNAVYAPAARHLPDRVPLTVVPDGPLYRLPFSALVHRMPGGRFAPEEARFVLHDRPVATELASSLVVDTATTARRPSFSPTLAAFGVASFDTLRTVPPALRTALPRAARDSAVSLSSLPGVPAELRAVRQLVDKATVALGADATEPAFRAACRRASVIHVASHAVVHPSSPLHNALLLRPGSSSDGVLFLHELREQRQRIPLVVLSGCGTARGVLRGGEGMAGLQYAFRAMGAQATVSSLWPVADQASVALTKEFYRHLQAGASKDRALRQAKLTYLDRHPTRASPFFWAPSVLYGSPRPLSVSSSSTLPTWVWWCMGLGAGVMGTLLLWARRTGRLRRSPSDPAPPR